MSSSFAHKPALLTICLLTCNLAGCIGEAGSPAVPNRARAPQHSAAEISSGSSRVTASEAPCAASIDLLNGVPNSSGMILARTAPVSVSGWSAHDLRAGDANDSVFVSLVNRRDGRETLFATRKNPRDDVKAYIGRPEMADLGYESTFRIDDLMPGPYRLSLYTGWAGELVRCSTPALDVTIAD